jgi:hypothetical protein
MDLVQVNVVGAQAREAGIDGVENGFARQAATVWRLTHGSMYLGGEHDLFAAREVLQGAADDLLGSAVGIHIGGVEEIDAELECLNDDGPTLLLRKRPGMIAALGNAKCHATQTELGDLQACGP